MYDLFGMDEWIVYFYAYTLCVRRLIRKKQFEKEAQKRHQTDIEKGEKSESWKTMLKSEINFFRAAGSWASEHKTKTTKHGQKSACATKQCKTAVSWLLQALDYIFVTSLTVLTYYSKHSWTYVLIFIFFSIVWNVLNVHGQVFLFDFFSSSRGYDFQVLHSTKRQLSKLLVY